MSTEPTGQDFVVSELLAELKAEGERKDQTNKLLVKIIIRIIISAFIVVVLLVGGFLIFLNQYSMESSTTTTTTTTKTADGAAYEIIDSSGAVVSSDLTPEQITEMIKSGEVTVTNGESDNDNHDNNNAYPFTESQEQPADTKENG